MAKLKVFGILKNKIIKKNYKIFVKYKDSSQEIKHTIQQFNAKSCINRTLNPIKHSFTHYHLTINPVIVDCPEQTLGFRPISQLKVGVPTPVNKILAQLV